MNNFYNQNILLNTNQWNNQFSNKERDSILWKAELIIPSYKEILSINEIELWTDIVFEEANHLWEIRSCTWLKHIYQLWKYRIFDNHNHALSFRWESYINNWPLPVIHIDQHSDLNTPDTPINKKHINSLEYIREYANYTCNVGNFIPPALDAWIITQCEQARTESKLLDLQIPTEPFILDLDLDFWAPEMSILKFDETILKTKFLIEKAQLVTIATSPYFLEQKKALKLLLEIL